jgi:hypothetical protein
MTEQSQQPTAKIYQFPKRPHPTSASSRNLAKPALQQTAASFPTAPCNGSWYHDAAIEQAEQACDLQHQQH